MLAAVLAAVLAASLGLYFGRRSASRSEEALRPLPEGKIPESQYQSQEGQPEQRVPAVPLDLVRACADEECIVFLGSGLGAQVGLPTWTEFLNSIIRQTVSPDSQTTLAHAASTLEGRPTLQAEFIRENVSEDEIAQMVRTTFERPVGNLSRACRILGQIPFAGAVAATWDLLPEAIFTARAPGSFTLADGDELPRLFRENRFTILRLNGDIRRPDTLLLTPVELTRLLYEDPAINRTVLSLFATRTILFVGLSLDGINDLLEAFPTYLGQGSRPHYALVPWDAQTIARAPLFLSRYGIRLLPYVASSRHPELTAFLDGLNSQISQSARSTSPRSVRMAKLNSVQLENIGSFEHLDLSFEDGWTVLLGNNGSGKSTVLRAIALGICGDDSRAMSSGARLLRAGTRKGMISLKIGGDSYRTELIRDQNRVIVRSRQITPLQAGTWLVLGFPPLRGVPAAQPSGPSESGFPSPTVDDLLPLLLDLVDNRLSNIKQWIVNAENDRLASGRQSKDLLAHFFRLINALTPDLSFDYAGVSEEYDVKVKTDDGLISIDFVSQGTSSVLNWCGTLIERMYEIYPASKSPWLEPAVVLIDEVDAHMHPEWQRMLVALMQQNFPSVQVIATTHSPLVVGNLESGHVVGMRRFKEKVTAEVVPVEMRGWSPDDILTAPGFDMSTTREPETDELQDEYTKLFAKGERTEEEDERLRELAGQLSPRLLRPLSPKGQAQAAFSEWIDEKWQDQPPERRERLLRESQLYVAQLVEDEIHDEEGPR